MLHPTVFLKRIMRIIRALEDLKYHAAPKVNARIQDAANRLATAIGVRRAFNGKKSDKPKRRRRSKAKKEAE